MAQFPSTTTPQFKTVWDSLDKNIKKVCAVCHLKPALAKLIPIVIRFYFIKEYSVKSKQMKAAVVAEEEEEDKEGEEEDLVTAGA